MPSYWHFQPASGLWNANVKRQLLKLHADYKEDVGGEWVEKEVYWPERPCTVVLHLGEENVSENGLQTIHFGVLIVRIVTFHLKVF